MACNIVPTWEEGGRLRGKGNKMNFVDLDSKEDRL